MEVSHLELHNNVKSVPCSCPDPWWQVRHSWSRPLSLGPTRCLMWCLSSKGRQTSDLTLNLWESIIYFQLLSKSTKTLSYSYIMHVVIAKCFCFIYHRYFNGGPPAETDFGGDVSVIIIFYVIIHFANSFRLLLHWKAFVNNANINIPVCLLSL